MTRKELLERANAILDRVFVLDEGVSNSYAFRALLEELHSKDLSVVKEPHIGAITMVRAGILRAAIGSTMALLDRKDRRGNRASIGQILIDLSDTDVAGILVETRTAEFAALTRRYTELVDGDLYQRGVRLRNDAIAHLLDQNTPTPIVRYEDVFELHDSAAAQVRSLHMVCGRKQPYFLEQIDILKKRAAVFWGTYFDGMKSEKN